MDKKEQTDNRKIARFERLLDSYANSRHWSRKCFSMAAVERTLLKLVKEGADKAHPDSLLVALAGAKSALASSYGPYGEYESYINQQKKEAISRSAQWLVSFMTGKPRFLARHSHLASAPDLTDMIKQLLSRLLEEYFPAAKPAPATASV